MVHRRPSSRLGACGLEPYLSVEVSSGQPTGLFRVQLWFSHPRRGNARDVRRRHRREPRRETGRAPATNGSRRYRCENRPGQTGCRKAPSREAGVSPTVPSPVSSDDRVKHRCQNRRAEPLNRARPRAVLLHAVVLRRSDGGPPQRGGRHSTRNLSNSSWNLAGSRMYGAWLPPGMTTIRPCGTDRASISPSARGIV